MSAIGVQRFRPTHAVGHLPAGSSLCPLSLRELVRALPPGELLVTFAVAGPQDVEAVCLAARQGRALVGFHQPAILGAEAESAAVSWRRLRRLIFSSAGELGFGLPFGMEGFLELPSDPGEAHQQAEIMVGEGVCGLRLAFAGQRSLAPVVELLAEWELGCCLLGGGEGGAGDLWEEPVSAAGLAQAFAAGGRQPVVMRVPALGAALQGAAREARLHALTLEILGRFQRPRLADRVAAAIEAAWS